MMQVRDGRLLRGPVRISLPPDWSFLPMLRLAVASMVSDLGLTYEELQDLKLLMGEGFALIVTLIREMGLEVASVEVELSVDLMSRMMDISVSAGVGRRLWVPGEKSLELFTDEVAEETEGLRLELMRNVADDLELSCSEGMIRLRATKRLSPLSIK